jgi:hypothetical protein
MDQTIVEVMHKSAGGWIAALVASNVLLFLAVIALTIRSWRLMQLYTRLTRGASGANLEELLLEYADTVHKTADRLSEAERAIERLAEVQRRCVQHVAVVRYDAFEDVGGEQSFALAALDERGVGVVLSSVYSRSDVRVYAKEMRNGKPSHALSSEEQRAIARARES